MHKAVFSILAEGSHAVVEPSEGFKEQFNKLWPSWPMMLATLVSLIIIMIILYFLMYKPVKKSLAARQKFIQDNIDKAKENNASSELVLAQVNKRLKQAHIEVDSLINDAKRRGDKVIEKYTDKAKAEANRIISEAKIDIEIQKQKFLKESKKHIASAATTLSEKILKQHVDSEIHNQIIDDFLTKNEDK
ncbi:ATP synthase B chain [Mycoplasmopsis bovigenitalium 51080]|uniref:ATP synthase subunit b n=1 Tax=Mycoplasmopsis bovigenitalium 51080 TaxID=1188235 RepID=N9TV77_9BACT|nr:F0F1 ATP synthase subunit B [Mycoplasmopsis bovigenitalium]ENY70034.1 ATP synthase B chain [Mycoplasmopsis bovigenitalium 51080]